jgi:Ala-tRNA(Pro) deacylase
LTFHLNDAAPASRGINHEEAAMSVAPRLRHYLDAQHVDYEILEHRPTQSAMQTARACHIPADQLAKAVLLDTRDDYLLAVLPSDRRLDLAELREELGQKPRLADENELTVIFNDCAMGAVPALGTGYDVATIVDDRLTEQPDIYFEGGDHASLIHVDQSGFRQLTRSAQHGRFSERWSEAD